MSFRFHRGIPHISIFHSPSSPPSVQALTLLRSSLTKSYPPSAQPPKALEFNLDVIENSPPTADQFSTILSYISKPMSSLLSAHPTSSSVEQPHTTQGLHDLVSSNPKAMKWPVVVNWDDGQAAVGDVEGVKGILESLRRKRDGEDTLGAEVHQPSGWFT
ncbi:thioredoxin-like protein [Gautieria morchelliformis]|nr:thioredoxin-like protein [Gautieria morchelliformis]